MPYFGIPIRNGLPIGLGSVAALSAVQLFSPSSLFAGGVEGTWYDPSDFDRYMSALGPELVTNGDFSSGTTGWLGANGGSIANDSGTLKITSGAGGFGYGYTSISTTPGKAYKVAFAVTAQTEQSNLRLGSTQFGFDLAFPAMSSPGQYSLSFIATTATTWLTFRAGASASSTLNIDNISVRELTAIDTATLFQDSAGTTPVTAVEQPVGLMLDKSKGLVLGSEVVVNGNFATDTNWTKVSGVTISGGQLVLTSVANTSGAAYQDTVGAYVAGNWYVVEFDYATTGGASVYLQNSGFSTPTISGTGHYKGIFYAGFSGNRTAVGCFSGTTTTATIDNISVRKLPGNHAFQTTSTSRPVLSARYNLLTKTEQFDDAAWSKENATVTQNSTASPDGTTTADTLFETSATGRHRAYQLGTITNGASVRAAISLKDLSRRYGVVLVSSSTAFLFYALIDLQTGTLLESQNFSGASGYSSASVTSQENGWYRVVLTGTVADTSASLQVFTFNASTIGGNSALLSYAGDISKGLYLWGADLRVTNDAAGQPAYQRVNTSTDYDTTGFKPYLRFDGTDDWLQTNSINFTGTDKMTVFAGVRKLSDAALGIVAELSVDGSATNGGFYFAAAVPAGSGTYQFGFRGTALGTLGAAAVAPDTSVMAGTADISAPLRTIRRNGELLFSSTSSMGTGNYGNYPLYIGRRGGTTLPFNGRIYGLIVRGAQSTAQQITNTENWLNQRTGAY